MKQVKVSIPPEMNQRIMEMQKDERFAGLSYLEIVQMLFLAGLDSNKQESSIIMI